MSLIDANRNLLFGILALQNGLIDQGQLVAGFQAWTRDKNRPLADYLLHRGDLDSDDRAAVEALVARHLKKHQDDPEKSLASVPIGRGVREQLAGLADPQVDATLAHLGSSSSASAVDLTDRTLTYSVGAASSEGQRFRILRPHARGGLGAVYVALDDELHREVALKQILDDHADDATSRQRFLLEAEITGGLEHPGIVPVYGLGTYADGRPFYAMRFIRGDSLKDAIARFHADAQLKQDSGARSLELRKLLNRFLDVCNAIEYAHTRGVLHRDLKPGNIIVGKHGETLVVDWGLAKATGHSDPAAEERTLRPASTSGSSATLAGSAMGTPAYMSPEQARGDLEHLGPASDVYSLGATLFSLLTGKPPIAGKDIGAILKAVQEGAIPAPRQFDPSIDRALEEVCRKAMALRPEDRYESARALADDIERWMADEPVTAWCEPWPRQALRWLTRHRVGVTTAAVAGLVAMIGLAGIGLVQAQANRKLGQKNTELLVANQREAKANEDLRLANQREQERFDLAMEAVKTFHTGVTEDFLLQADEFKEQRNKLLGSARTFYEKLEPMLQGATDLRSRRALGGAYSQLATLIDKIGTREEGLAACERAIVRWEEICSAEDATTADRLQLATMLDLSTRSLLNTGKTDESLTRLQRARSLVEQATDNVLQKDPSARATFAMISSHIAYDVLMMGKKAEAVEIARKARARIEQFRASRAASVEEDRGYLALLRREARALDELGDFEQAARLGRLAMDLAETRLHSNPSDWTMAAQLTDSLNNLGIILWKQNKLRECAAIMSRKRELDEVRVQHFPAIREIQMDLAIGLNNEAEILNRIGRSQEALQKNQRALEIRERGLAGDPTDLYSRDDVSSSHSNIGDTLTYIGRLAEAEQAYDRAVQLEEAVVASDSKTPYWRYKLGAYLAFRGDVAWWSGKLDEAFKYHQRAHETRETVVRDQPDDVESQQYLAESCLRLDRLYEQSGNAEEALRYRQRAFDLLHNLAKDQPDNLLIRADWAASLARKSWAAARDGKPGAAVASLRQAIELVDSNVEFLDIQFLLGSFHALLSAVASNSDSGLTPEDAEAEAKKAVEILRKAAFAGYRPLPRYQTDPDLDPLRKRDDFQSLLKDLEQWTAAPENGKQ